MSKMNVIFGYFDNKRSPISERSVTIQAIKNVRRKRKKAFLFPNSFAKAPRVAAQGTYKREKTARENAPDAEMTAESPSGIKI